MRRIFLIATIIILGTLNSCEYEYIEPYTPPPPRQPKNTENLEASFTNSALTLTSSYWNDADYHEISVEDISKNKLYDDGYLNMTGTYNGVSDFNGGVDPGLLMKAAYDNEYLYILIQWTDASMNASFGSWLWNGPSDPLKSDTTGGWTSQRNSDVLTLEFDVASGSITKDYWEWNLALSEPMGFMLDKNYTSANGLQDDAGKQFYYRNSNGNTGRSGPLYEWDGISQAYTKPDGTNTILDPAYFIYNKSEFLGDPAIGHNVWMTNADAACGNCHGEFGQGKDDSEGFGPALNHAGVNRYSRQNIIDYTESENHSGQHHVNFTRPSDLYYITPENANHLFAYLRGLTGVPGYYIELPDGSCADVTVSSNMKLTKMATTNTEPYKIMIKRRLATGSADDIIFDTSNLSLLYNFNIFLSDNDGINKIGSSNEVLKFNKKLP